jgi:tetratricopeptide (TPR) repeat protein
MQELLDAMKKHQAGDLSGAALGYRRVLARQPEHADGLHLLGVVRHQQGDQTQALELIGRAVALSPSVPAFHNNLAEVYRALGQYDRAAGCCRMALQLLPDYPEALCNLGLALHGLGRPGEAVAPFCRALDLQPIFAAAHSNLGIVLRELDRFDEALVHFRAAVALDANFAAAQTNLGQMLLDQGLAEEALPHCQEAVRLQPNQAALQHNLGHALRSLGRPVEARAAYLEALRLDPNLARSHAHLGLLLMNEGKPDEAFPWLTRAVEIEPQNADFGQYLAELYAEQEDFAQAIPCWEQVLAAAPDRVGARVALGWALQEEGRLTEAGAQYREALRLRPDWAPAQLHLGGLNEELGTMAEAEAAFREALRLQPRYAHPLARLAMLLREALPDADLAALEERLADPQLEDEPRARLLFALAHVLDGRGLFAHAADCLRRSNALGLELAIRRGHVYAPAEHERFVGGLRDAFGPDWFRRLAGAGLTTRRPVFIVGLPRSGTTLIEQVLASHSCIYGAGELRLLRRSFDAIPEMLGRSESPLACVPYLDHAAAGRLAERHLEKLRALDEGAHERIVDKMPDNYLYLGLLAAIFPRATVIHCRRDLRDVAISCWMSDFRSIRWANDPEHIATRLAQYGRLMEHWKKVLPIPVHEVDYEEAVGDLEGVARRLIDACGMPWQPACLEFYKTRRPIRTASVTQVRQPVYTRSVARWRNYEEELSDLLARVTEANPRR